MGLGSEGLGLVDNVEVLEPHPVCEHLMVLRGYAFIKTQPSIPNQTLPKLTSQSGLDSDFGFQVSGVGFRVSGFGFWVSGSEVGSLMQDFWHGCQSRVSGDCTWRRWEVL